MGLQTENSSALEQHKVQRWLWRLVSGTGETVKF